MKAWKKWVIAYAIVFLFTILPLLSVLLAQLLAMLLGCDTDHLNEGAAPDCTGGDFIGMLFVAGWLGLISFPVGALLFAAVALVHIIWFARKKIREKKNSSVQP